MATQELLEEFFSQPKEPLDVAFTHRILIDIFVSFLAGFFLSWFITPMDAAVIESMSGKTTLLSSLSTSIKQMTKPYQYMRLLEFGVVVVTYGATYMIKNITDTVCIASNQSASSTAFWQFWLVFVVNGGLSVLYKDPILTKRFGLKSSTPLPLFSYLWWVARDSCNVLGAFLFFFVCHVKHKVAIK
ncbi:hypothetical protein RFI_09670 [Reticulomyxa filosa]|uniref:Uncharacterized protein n=1 Tax=Reticulomyxa filosa TaxID=46433 RepID=X6NNG3_RETFI|nr:hypothetical protein RFI_09670 [Reticulomyxa filosa]|eukprot:ETO27463.1 hypothetical protein RFI_09670 [Reticulomyxa filosa]